MSERLVWAAYAVDWFESERGWGSKIDDTSYYKTKEEADRIVENWEREELKRNPSGITPDYYYRPLKPRLVDLGEKQYKEIFGKKKR